MNDYLQGKKLYGDDFSYEQIENWYKEEVEGYANLGSKNSENYSYSYHELNKFHGFSKLKKSKFQHALGFGSAYGFEFKPIIDKIAKLTIVEPSENLRSKKIGNLTPAYVTPEISGKLDFNDGEFDLITCFGALHHIPNVTFVTNELIRVLQPGGFLLIREPIISMGDWNRQRRGLTKHERGIPIPVFENIFAQHKFLNVSYRGYCLTLTPILQRTVGKLLRKSVYSYRTYLKLDGFLSNALKRNVRYHPRYKLDKLYPSNIFYVIEKARAV